MDECGGAWVGSAAGNARRVALAQIMQPGGGRNMRLQVWRSRGLPASPGRGRALCCGLRGQLKPGLLSPDAPLRMAGTACHSQQPRTAHPVVCSGVLCAAAAACQCGLGSRLCGQPWRARSARRPAAPRRHADLRMRRRQVCCTLRWPDGGGGLALGGLTAGGLGEGRRSMRKQPSPRPRGAAQLPRGGAARGRAGRPLLVGRARRARGEPCMRRYAQRCAVL